MKTAFFGRVIESEDSERQSQSTNNHNVDQRNLKCIKFIRLLLLQFLVHRCAVFLGSRLISKCLKIQNGLRTRNICNGNWRVSFFDHSSFNTLSKKVSTFYLSTSIFFSHPFCLTINYILGLILLVFLQYISIVNYLSAMIPVEIDIKKIDEALLFGNGRNNVLAYEPLDHLEIQKLCEIVDRLFQLYLENLNGQIGGNWGLFSLRFQFRNGIMLYNQFQNLKYQKLVPNINMYPEDFLLLLETIEPNSNFFAQRCQLLNLDPVQVIRSISATKQDGNICFELNERVFAQDQYLSEPGSLASDILEQFSYEEYVTVRSVWSQQSVEEEEINIPQIPIRYQMRKRPIKQDVYFKIVKQEHTGTKRTPKHRKGKRPTQKKQMNLLLKFVDATKKKQHNRKVRRVARAEIRRREKKNKMKRSYYDNFDDDFNQKDSRQNYQSVILKTKKKRNLRKKPARKDNDQYYSVHDESNTGEIQSSNIEPEAHHLHLNRIKKAFYKLSISRINLNDLIVYQSFPEGISRDYLYILQQMNHLTKISKVQTIFKKSITNSLTSKVEIQPSSIIEMRLICNCYKLLPNRRQLIVDFMKYYMAVQFSKLAGTLAFSIIDDEYEIRDEMSVHIQMFKGFASAVAQQGYQKLKQEIAPSYLVEQFLAQCLNQLNFESESSLNFSKKSLKVIFNTIFQGSTLQSIISCRLAEKILYSQNIFGSESSSSTPTTTCIAIYKKHCQKLSHQQLGSFLKLMISIEQKYPTFWTFEQFSTFINLIDFQKRQWTVHTERYLTQCVRIYIQQQLSSGNNQYKHLLNQILKQSFLGSVKYKQGSSNWHSIYLTVVEAILKFPIFKNQFVYKQIFMEIEGFKITETNFRTITMLIMESLRFSVEAQKKSFQKMFQSGNDKKLNEYKQITKMRMMLLDLLEGEDRHRQFKANRNNEESSRTTVEEIYSIIFEPSSLPQMFALKLTMLLQDRKLASLLSKTEYYWSETKNSLVNTIMKFFFNPKIEFEQEINSHSELDDDDLSQLFLKQAKHKNYCTYVFSLIANQFNPKQKSIFNIPLSLSNKSKNIILTEFAFYGCKLALKVIVDKTLTEEIIRYSDYILNNKYDHLVAQCGKGVNFLFCFKLFEGALNIFLGWNQYKKLNLEPVFHFEISSLILNLSLIQSLEAYRDQMIKLHVEALNYQQNKLDTWKQFLGQFYSKSNHYNLVYCYIDSLIQSDVQSVFLDFYFKKYQKEILKIKSSEYKSNHFILFIFDLLISILSWRERKFPQKIDFLINMIVPHLFNQEVCLLTFENRSRNITSRMVKLFLLLLQHKEKIAQSQVYIERLVSMNVRWQYQSYSSVKENPHSYLLAPQTHLQIYVEICEELHGENSVQYSQSLMLMMFELILNNLYQNSKIGQASWERITDSIIKKSSMFARFFEQYRISIINQKYYQM